jgi:hypothetical protein
MFINHQPIIGNYARKNPDNFFQAIQFTLLTIQQSLHTVPKMMQDVNAKGDKSGHLWGVKGDAWRNLGQRKGEVYDAAMSAYDSSADPAIQARELLLYTASLPGLGMVKGGFVCQLAFGLVGCLDSHNAQRFGLTRSQLSAHAYKNAKTMATRYGKVDGYLSLCAELGGCAGLWDSWCTYVADRNTYKTYSDAQHVSKLHCDALGLSC